MRPVERTAPKVGEHLRRMATVEKTGDARTVRFVASDETVDRYGDIIRASGWELTNFAKNNVLLFGHDNHSPPIGTVKAWVEGTRLLSDATFLPEGTSEFADEIWRITDAGALKAVSVGFLPTVEPNVMRGPPDPVDGWQPFLGFEFIGQELLELSVVPVPANPQAIALARSLARPETMRALFLDADASARVAAAGRARSITLARLRVGHFKGEDHVA